MAVLAGALGAAPAPSVVSLDAHARAEGNRRGVAVTIGASIFRTRWPAQVLKVYVDGVGKTEIAGLRISGVKFHHVLTRKAFDGEIESLVAQTFAAAPVREVDVMAVVPLRVGKDVVVSGDLATPTSRNVFTVSVQRGESAASLARRIAAGRGIYLDQEWARSALK